MSWVAVALAVGGAVMGHQKQQREEQIEDADTKLAAADQRYAWAQQRNPGQANIRRAGSMFGNVAGGALSGYTTGATFGASNAGGTWWDKENSKTPMDGGEAPAWWGGK